jgi:L-rhamnose isomerase
MRSRASAVERAQPVDAQLARVAEVATSSAVSVVRVGVHTLAVADIEALLAREGAGSGGADLTGRASGVASTAVLIVREQVDAEPTAFVEA